MSQCVMFCKGKLYRVKHDFKTYNAQMQFETSEAEFRTCEANGVVLHESFLHVESKNRPFEFKLKHGDLLMYLASTRCTTLFNLPYIGRSFLYGEQVIHLYLAATEGSESLLLAPMLPSYEVSK